MWYVSYGVKSAVQGMFEKAPILNQAIELHVLEQGEQRSSRTRVSIPDDVSGIVVLNLPSYAGGTNLWGPSTEAKYSVVSMNDGRIEIIGLRNISHLGQIHAGLSSGGIRLGQSKYKIEIAYLNNAPDLPGKIDGEPWLQRHPAIFSIGFATQSQMLARTGCAMSISYNATKTGWMFKKGAQRKSMWRLRWFVLKHRLLYYFVTTQDVAPKGMIDLHFATVEDEEGVCEAGESVDKAEGLATTLHRFCIHTPKRRWKLMCETKGQKAEWILLIDAMTKH